MTGTFDNILVASERFKCFRELWVPLVVLFGTIIGGVI